MDKYLRCRSYKELVHSYLKKTENSFKLFIFIVESEISVRIWDNYFRKDDRFPIEYSHLNYYSCYKKILS